MEIDFLFIKEKLVQMKDNQNIFGDEYRVSSVVMPFVPKKNNLGLILTKRSTKLKSHPGQVSFPGGTFDEGDETLVQTALREWEEEVGKPSSSLEVIGEYYRCVTITGYQITPFICLYHGDMDFPNFNQKEVETVFELKLDELFTLPFYCTKIQRPFRDTIYYIDHPVSLIWGATAHIIVSFMKDFANFNRSPILVQSNIPEPPFFNPKLNYTMQ